jgi:ribonucleoside-diphosphate reductase alpha chain
VLRVRNNTLEMMRALGIDVEPFLRHLQNMATGELEEAKVFLKVGPAVEDAEGPEQKAEGTTAVPEKCPVCGSARLVHQSGCVNCLDCGWSACIAG